ncbi:MAG: hypothetical protein LQ346_001571 [Caloplaca aetnensis]|nr:MAG: hypothetical protein LQ346_001571 [Caloplaca aetnensis]
MSALLPDTKFFRLFLEFYGPATILLQSRAARLNDVLTTRDINDIADAPAGAIQKRISIEADDVSRAMEEQEGAPRTMRTKPPQMNTASIGPDGKVVFTKDNT